MNSPDPFSCYAIRRLNPFHGVIQVVANEHSRAFSHDGTQWELQLLAECPDDMWGAPAAGEPTLQFLRFGVWNCSDGLRQVPAHPLLDLDALLPRSRQLVETLARVAGEIPFPLRDHYELWLLDGHDRLPLALLASAVEAPRDTRPAPLHWRCAERAGADFNAPEADRTQPPHPRDSNPHPHMSALDRLVAIESGHRMTQWFLRRPDGSGRGLPIAGIPRFDQRQLPADAFPQLLLREQWGDCYDSELVADYLDWMAPWLLTLQRLGPPQRKRLERAARRRALLMSHCFRFYPRVIDRAGLDAARVEARIREAG